MKSLFTILISLIIGITLIYIFQLSRLQIFTDNYRLNGINTSVKKIAQIPQRGYIMDRNGKVIVGSIPTFDINYTKILLSKNFDTLSFCNTVKISKDEFKTKLNFIENTQGFNPINSYTFIKNLTQEEVAEIEEKFYKYDGFTIQKKFERKYLTNYAGNILGYINETNQKEIDNEPDYYEPSDYIGRTGIEKSYERFLRGNKGIYFVQKDISLNSVGPYKKGKYDIEMESGQDLMLTIDIDLQEYAEKLLVNKRGAVVAIDPNNGEILCMASAPSINPNSLTGREKQKNIYAYLNDSMQKPMFDRAVQNAYPPGSTFKTISALVALQMGVIDTNTTFTCYYGSNFGKRRIKCHDAGIIHLKPAISNSCNSYFAKTYIKILSKDSTDIEKSINQWNSLMQSFGLGKYFNNDVSVGTKGNIPNASYYNKWYKKGNWNAYTTISNGIGQGEVSLSPMQMANFTAAIANKGFYFTPHLVKEIAGKAIKDSSFLKSIYTKVDKKYFHPVIEGMKRVFTNGTARKSRSIFFTQAGKTGTSQVPHGQVDHSNFIMFAPADNPKIAIAVVVENGGSGASIAAPIASLVAERYLFGDTQRKPLEKAMMAKNLNASYQRYYIIQMKKKGWYKPPELTKEDSRRIQKKDSIKNLQADKEKNLKLKDSAQITEKTQINDNKKVEKDTIKLNKSQKSNKTDSINKVKSKIFLKPEPQLTNREIKKLIKKERKKAKREKREKREKEKQEKQEKKLIKENAILEKEKNQ